MKVLVFDTETTGLPKNNPSIYQTDLWPYIVQLSYVIYDVDNMHLITEQDHIIKLSESINISEESVKIHGISKEKSNTLGINIKTALKKFIEDMKTVDLLVGHNISFDKRMIIVECIRNKIQGRFPSEQAKYFCTMKKGTEICKIEAVNKETNETYFKYPKLEQLYYNFFKTKPRGLHNSLVDVHACLACFLEMHNTL